MARIRVNVVCLVGIAIALFSMTGAWSYYSPGVLVPQLFVLGTLIALLTPIGGIIQFMSVIETVLLWKWSDYDRFQYLTMMPFIAMFASIIVLLSMISPTWISRDDGTFPRSCDRTHIIQRLLTFWVIREIPSEEA